MKINKKEVTICTICPNCDCVNGVQVNESDYIAWQDGELTQIAFPYLSAEDREKLIGGFCKDCWGALFGGAKIDEEWSGDDENYDLEVGFDPYMGCYTEDC